MNNVNASISAQEISLPTNKRSRLAGAIWMALEFAGEFTDLIIIEGSPIYAKSVTGTIKLCEILKEGASFEVTKSDIKAFFGYHVNNLSTKDDPEHYWSTEVAPILLERNSISKSIKTPRNEYLRFSLYQVQGGRVSMTVKDRCITGEDPDGVRLRVWVQ